MTDNERPSWTAVVLAGGLGTRLSAVCPDTPKPLVPVLGRPFLDWALLYLRACSIERVVISVGFRAERFVRYYDHCPVAGLEVRTVEERESLGTAGGFCHAAEAANVRGNVAVVNGDSLLLTPLRPILDDFAQRPEQAGIVAVGVSDASRYGTLDIDADGHVRGFREKQPGAGAINAGIYLFRTALAASFPTKRPLSFESDVFPELIASGCAIRTYRCEAPFIDIGVPESYAQSAAFLGTYFEPFLHQSQT